MFFFFGRCGGAVIVGMLTALLRLRLRLHALLCISHVCARVRVCLFHSRASSMVVHDLDMTNGVFNISVAFNETLTLGLELATTSSLIADAVFRQLSPTWPASKDDEPVLLLQGVRDQPLARKLNDFDLISLIGPSICTCGPLVCFRFGSRRVCVCVCVHVIDCVPVLCCAAVVLVDSL